MTGFTLLRLDLAGAPGFEALLGSARFDDVTRGRIGNHLTRPSARGAPIVRTTTRYTSPQACFSAAHEALVARVRGAAALPDLDFNHALLEVYDQRYRKMGYHSDQAQDLEEGSSVAIVSLYDRPPRGPGVRQLMIQHKLTGERAALPLEHGSAVLFSLDTNSLHRHKIVLPSPAPQDTRWLGLTLRQSKTFVRHHAGGAALEDGTPLTLADEAQRAELLRLRAEENRSTTFRYPRLTYTLSEGDRLAPVEAT